MSNQTDAGTLDIAYRTIDTPVGRLLLAQTGRGLLRVAYEREGFDEVLQELSRRVSPRILHSPSRLDGLAAQFDEYFAGDRHRFDVQLDQRLSTGFRHKVQQYLPRIDYGFTHSYKQVAEKVGNPAAARAVGAACATNPLPIVVPCHRVLRSDGGLGGYVGGLDAKSTLLTSEHARWATRTAGPQTSREDPTTRQPSA
ncbi:MAG: methylated-DNA--[protein]-cysteine S-methyltransferase [Brooklawnia sp.]